MSESERLRLQQAPIPGPAAAREEAAELERTLRENGVPKMIAEALAQPDLADDDLPPAIRHLLEDQELMSRRLVELSTSDDPLRYAKIQNVHVRIEQNAQAIREWTEHPAPNNLPPAFRAKHDHPSHYGGRDNPYEAIKVIEAWGLDFCLGNLVKYVSRAGKKAGETKLDDLRKARWYLDRAISNLEAKKEPPTP